MFSYFKLHKTIANIYFNKECLKHKLTPTNAKIKIKDTNKAATKIKQQSQTLRINKKIKTPPHKEKWNNNCQLPKPGDSRNYEIC